MTQSTIFAAMFLAGTFLASHSFAETSAPGTLKERVKIGSNRIEASGCHHESRGFTTHVPNVEHLDRTSEGVLSGIEFERVTGNGQITNVTWTPDGDSISYQLSAKGGGHWVDPPKVFGAKLGGGACVGATGAWLEVNVFAIYDNAVR